MLAYQLTHFLQRGLLSRLFDFFLLIILPVGHSISYKIACAPNEDLDHLAHSLSLIKVRCPPEKGLDP